MGKNLIQQRRGKGGPRFRAPSFRYEGEARYGIYTNEKQKGNIIDIIHCQGHSGPLAQIRYENGEKILVQAPEGIRTGDSVFIGDSVPADIGNTMQLKNIPEGAAIYNVESNPGDGGKFARTSGAFARIIAKMKDKVIVQLPSKKERSFLPECRATMGIVAGSGKTEKPFLKAGNKFYAMRARNKLWPIVCGQSMNAVAHPHGGSRSSKKNYSYTVSRHAPPGAKVGSIAARRTGRK